MPPEMPRRLHLRKDQIGPRLTGFLTYSFALLKPDVVRLSSGGRLTFLTRFTSLLFVVVLPGVCRAAEPGWLRRTCADFAISIDCSHGDLENFALTCTAFRQISRELLVRPGASVPPYDHPFSA